MRRIAKHNKSKLSPRGFPVRMGGDGYSESIATCNKKEQQ